MKKDTAAVMHASKAKTPPCFGRWQGETEIVVKERWQALRPAGSHQINRAAAGDAGCFYIEGYLTPEAAIRTLAGPARANGGRLPQLSKERGFRTQCGAITKLNAKKTETVFCASRL